MEYTIGLDIGTASVGWAVIDDGFALLKGKKRIKEGEKTSRKRTNLWGSRIFNNAETAADRRLKRSMRRRIARRSQRLRLLRELFEPEILQIDDSFFIRLNESFYQNKDAANKTVPTKYPLFNGKTGKGETFSNEQDYYTRYPTIYHLRERLVNDRSQADIRLVFLALNHITKFRGHFINEDNTFNLTNIDISRSLSSLITSWNLYFENNPEATVAEHHEDSIEKMLKEKISPSYKRDKIEREVLKIKSTSLFSEMIKIAVGNQANLKKVFDLDEDMNITASAEDFDEKIASLTDEQQDLVRAAQKVNNDMLLDESLLNGSLSAKMIEKYETHQKQLHDLKKFAKNHTVFQEIFGPEKDKTTFGIYTKYIQGVGNPSKTYGPKIDEFYNDLRKLIEEKVGRDNEFLEQVNHEMELGNYLLKQRTYTNGSIPFQVHRHEMRQIIENQRRYYPNVDWDKIIPLMQFRIPYYVGTLATTPGWATQNGSLSQDTTAYSKNSWVVRNNTDKITPWNFDEVVDRDASAVNFIERMTNFDTYLPNEKVLPKYSLTYQKYTVMNELTKIKIGDDFLTAQQKTSIFRHLFAGPAASGRVSKKMLVKFIKQEFPTSTVREDTLFGIDGKGMNASFTSFHDFERAGVNATKLLDESNYTNFDEIVKMQTVFEDKKILKKQLAERFGNFLTGDEIEKISKKHYTGWGRLSRKLLTDVFDNDGHSILWLLQNDTKHRNFQQIITDDTLPFAKTIETALSSDGDRRLSYEEVESLPGSPAIKRGIWQSLKIVDELVHYMGETPKNIVVEVARDNQNSRKTDTRKKKITDIVNKLKLEFSSDAIDKRLLDQFDNKDFDERLQLYFLQNGKDMYDGSTLDIDRLSSYQIDHIYPQNIIKDERLDNKVLVSAASNAKKTDRLPGEIFGAKMLPFWRRLEKSGAISQEKLLRLQKTRFSEGDLSGFIKRQLVETRQISKNVAIILKTTFGENVKIITPKAKFAHDLRINNGWSKNREVNDFHHAHDAYFNAVVGVFRERMGFENLYRTIIRSHYAQAGHRADELKRLAESQANSLTRDQIDTTTGEIWWNEEVRREIGKVFNYRDVNVVRKTENQIGKFGDETVYRKGDSNTIPAKLHNSALMYGGTKAPISAYGVVVRNKNGEIVVLSVPSMLGKQFRSSNHKLTELQSIYPHKKIAEIIVPQVDKYTKYIAKNGATRLFASYQEAQSGIELPIMSLPTKTSDEALFVNTFDKLASFIIKNQLFSEVAAARIPTVRGHFTSMAKTDKLKLINEMLAVTSGSNQGLTTLKKAGLGTTAQQLKGKDNLLGNGSTIIYQSPTGLYEYHKIV